MGGYVPRGSISEVGPPPASLSDPTIMGTMYGREPRRPVPLNPDPNICPWPVYYYEPVRWGYWLRLARYALTHPYTRTRVGC